MSMSTTLRRTSRAALAGAIIGVAVLAAAPAQAAGRNGVCEAGEFCLYYNSNHAGSVSDFTTSIPDYGATQPDCYEFKGAGSGQGQCVKNNAASAWNRTSGSVTVYFNSGYAGSSQTFAAGAKVNLNATLKNENASHKFGGSDTSGDVKMSVALYDATGGYLSCPFDGYVSTPGRHEGIDFTRSVGSSVYALVGGTVINVVAGSTGSSGLSTIAVYNSTYDKTVIYLHAAPTIAEGATVTRGQKIATESWRGVSSSGGAHTHVEMRPGYHELAAKSVNDYTLDNPDPTSFWNARGYVEK